ncbi:MAG: hypothetical protein AAF701_09135, partial [Pseudomonadota bacterium]
MKEYVPVNTQIRPDVGFRNIAGPTSEPTYRVLYVLAAIGRNGPIDLAGLTDVVDFPKPAIWRCCQALMDMGWVTTLHHDGSYMLTSRADEEFAAARYIPLEIEQVAPLFQSLRDEKNIYAVLSSFADTGQVTHVESTRRAAVSDKPLSLVYDLEAICALSVMPKNIQLRNIVAYLDHATADEKTDVSNGVLNAQLARVADQGYVASGDRSAFHYPWQCSNGAACCITIGLKVTSKPKILSFAKRGDQFLDLITRV